MAGGLPPGLAGLRWVTQPGVDTTYVAHVLPSEIVMSLGLGLAFVPLSSTALVGVADHDAGVASALVNTTQQVGGSLGTALLNTVAASATASYLASRSHTPAVVSAGLVHGYTTAFVYSVGLVALALVATVALVRASRHDLPAPEAVAIG